MRPFLSALLFGSLFLTLPARAADFSDDLIPHRWINRFAPEDVAEPNYPDYNKNDNLEKAKAQLSAGQYRRALVTINRAKNPDPIAAAIIRGKALDAIGRKEKALQVLSDSAVAQDPAVQVLKAHVLGELGKYADAVTLLQTTVTAHPDSVAAHYELGVSQEKTGDIADAKATLKWFMDQRFVDQWQGHPDSFTDAETVVTIGLGLDRWATLEAAYPQNRGLHDIVLSMFTKAYDEIDREYWPAHVAAAEYFLAHDDTGQAIEELTQAQQANPNDIHSLALLGKISLSMFNFDGADAAAAAIRRVDPDSIEADLIEARNYLQQRVPDHALKPLRDVLDRQPKNLEALGLLAGAEALRLHDDKSAEILRQVDQIDPNDAVAYYEVAEQLGNMRQYPRAAAMYKIAISRAPWWTAPRNGLGLLLTQSGDEAESKIVLDAAHTLDPFNVNTTNYLRLLDEMDSFARKETAHFIVMYDAKLDPVIPEYFADYMESVYHDVCSEYQFEPKVKTLIEVFPRHDEFAVRTTGGPWLPTVGASTGRIIALVTPRKGEGAMGAYNWAQVLRHEFTHTVTLGATDNRIGHWFTEGLAVNEEHTPLRWEWVPMLYHAVKQHELFSLDNLTWGFVRPKRPIDRQLAYAQSYWICKYVEEKYGHQAILNMMELFKDGKDQPTVFQTVFHQSEQEFSDTFFKWCDDQVSKWGYDDATSKKYEELSAKADALVKSRQYDEAIKAWEEIVKIRPMDALPHQRLAGLYMKTKQPAKAIEHLDLLSKVELKNNIYAKGVAKLYRDTGDMDHAIKRALDAVYIDPYDSDAHQLLESLYEKAGNTAGAEKEQHVIAILKDWKATQDSDAQQSR